MSVLVCITGRNNDKLMAKLKGALPNVDIYQWPHCDNLADIEFVLVWKAPEELWQQLPNLKVVQSFGAGVDGIPVDKLPSGVEVARIVDKQLSQDMAEYVLSNVLAYKLRSQEYCSNQSTSFWKPRRARQGKTAGILGMGELGAVVAKRLSVNGLNVRGWSRTAKQLDNIRCFHGEEQLSDFLSQLDYLVCLLPLTEATAGILSRTLFSMVSSDCLLINVARGQHLNEHDLIEALDSGELGHAVLDVFATEPLPKDHAFWSHPKVTVTPHVAAVTNLDTVVAQITDNINACLERKPIKNTVNTSVGY
ncbi:2-hydroxyacid dehydrogenase [Pseudoalteromonas obscura]|uniref:Glyoxylate/hydroxypyruvate reductase A n=1 Tax=Pseudoalteromonas obscura TaxID=3048491 RepID=A0ABT7EHM0_9GAMM|nr:glyoxylate/hydroxypyruvate reductase A [Pseudoalteromonas sp. P94(2023)]MDK2594554.1 glyoxylate/hydroxypyruvate reductase A [Pseudoalteromonas sp. P94(2023)]